MRLIQEPPNKLPAALRRAVVAADARGDKPRHQIAAEFGIHEWTLRQWCPRRYTPREQKEALQRDARELHWEGHTYAYIAKQLGVPTSTVWDWINRQ